MTRANRLFALAVAAILLLPLAATVAAFSTLSSTSSSEMAVGTPLVVTPTPAATAQQDAVALAQQGLAAFEAGDLVEAEGQFRSALALAPDAASVWNVLGLDLAQQERYPEGIAAFRRAAELEPAQLEFQVNLGTALLAAHQPDRAEAALQAALAIDPANALAHAGLGEIYRADGRTEDAIAAFEQAVAQDSRLVSAYQSLAVIHASAGDARRALGLLQQAVSLAPQDPSLYYDLGLAYLLDQQSEPARRHLLEAIRLAPGSEWALRGAGTAGRHPLELAVALDASIHQFPPWPVSDRASTVRCVVGLWKCPRDERDACTKGKKT